MSGTDFGGTSSGTIRNLFPGCALSWWLNSACTTEVSASVRAHPRIRLIEKSSADPASAEIIQQARQRLGGPMFALWDSDHLRWLHWTRDANR